jgi:hypothetical protein
MELLRWLFGVDLHDAYQQRLAFLAMVAIFSALGLIGWFLKKMRDQPPPLAAIIILASAVFAGWVLAVAPPRHSQQVNSAWAAWMTQNEPTYTQVNSCDPSFFAQFEPERCAEGSER